jgi:hypothetical protein
VTIHAQTGLTVRHADLATDHLTVVPVEGVAIIKEEGAQIQ